MLDKFQDNGRCRHVADSTLPHDCPSRRLLPKLGHQPIAAQQNSSQLLMMEDCILNREVRVAETQQTNGIEVLETREWLDSLDYVLSQGGPERAGRLLQQLALHARRAAGVNLPFTATTPYQNTIYSKAQPPFPGSQEMERRIKSLVRWNAMAMVVRANKIQEGIGGHISTFASAAPLYKAAFNHFFPASTDSGS